MERIYRVDMTGLSVMPEDLPRDLLGLGGRGFTSSIVSKEVPARCDPLSAENKLVFACGLLAGTIATTAGRISAGTKSPLTGGIKESNAGGTAGNAMGRLGVRGIIVEGKAAEGTYVLVIDAEGAKLERRDELRMAKSYEAVERLHGLFGKSANLILVGPAGEKGMRAASIIITDVDGRPTRHCGRGGTGAVMGTKGLKAVVIDDSAADGPALADPGKFKENARVFAKTIMEHPVSGEALPVYGTNVLANIINEAGAYPTRNFTEGVFEGVEKISGETMHDRIVERGGKPTHYCQKGCVIRCSNVYLDENGNHLASGLEYESIWANGANCGIDDLDVIARLDHLYDEIGVDSIEMGVALGVAMHAGVIPFGDGEGAIRLVEGILEGSEIGRVLAQGAKATGEHLKCGHVAVVKGQALPAYDPRAIKGMGVTYATSPMGADHTAGYAITTNILDVGGSIDPLHIMGQAELSKKLQIATAAIDSINVCLFVAFAALDNPDTLQSLVGMINSRYGWEMTVQNLMEMGMEILRRERLFNSQAGFTQKDDRLPEFFYNEKLPPHNHTFDVPDDEIDGLLDL